MARVSVAAEARVNASSASIVVNFPEGLIQKVVRIGEPEDPDVSRYHIVTNPLYRREGFARSGRKDKQTTLALVFVEVEGLIHRLERIQLMLEREFSQSSPSLRYGGRPGQGDKNSWD